MGYLSPWSSVFWPGRRSRRSSERRSIQSEQSATTDSAQSSRIATSNMSFGLLHRGTEGTPRALGSASRYFFFLSTFLWKVIATSGFWTSVIASSMTTGSSVTSPNQKYRKTSLRRKIKVMWGAQSCVDAKKKNPHPISISIAHFWHFLKIKIHQNPSSCIIPAIASTSMNVFVVGVFFLF